MSVTLLSRRWRSQGAAAGSGVPVEAAFTGRAQLSITNISNNTVSSVDPCPANNCVYTGLSHQGSVFNDTGMIYADDFGTLGSLVITGGGHNDYYGNEVYRYDVETGLWSRLTEPSLHVYNENTPTNQGNSALYWKLYHSQWGEGELWVDNDFNHASSSLKATRQDQPGPSHLFGYQVYLPNGYGHTDPQGALLTVMRPALTPIGSADGRRTHILPLSAPVWSRFSSNLITDNNAQTGAWLDTARSRVVSHVYGNFGGASLFVMATAGQSWASQATSVAIPPYLLGTWEYVASLDLYIYMKVLQVPSRIDKLDVVDPDTFVVSRPTATAAAGLLDSTTLGGFTWCEDLGAMVYYAGDGSSKCFTVTPGANPKTDPWTVAQLNFTGDTPAVQYSPGASFHMTRFRYVPRLKGFLWSASSTAAVQFWRAPIA